jgi:hypothetical protein
VEWRRVNGRMRRLEGPATGRIDMARKWSKNAMVVELRARLNKIDDRVVFQLVSDGPIKQFRRIVSDLFEVGQIRRGATSLICSSGIITAVRAPLYMIHVLHAS